MGMKKIGEGGGGHFFFSNGREFEEKVAMVCTTLSSVLFVVPYLNFVDELVCAHIFLLYGFIYFFPLNVNTTYFKLPTTLHWAIDNYYFVALDMEKMKWTK
jgi:hypothetical protein